jgi:hypothetical protein
MATTDTDTVRDLIESAFRKIGVVAVDEAMQADQAEQGLRALNRMVKAWQNKGYNLWSVASQSVTLTTAAVHTLNPVRPLDILSCRFKRSGVEMPMVRMTRNEYDNLPVKAAQGTPTQFYYDRQREAARLYVWPVLAAAAGETLEITYTREFEDMALTDAPDLPGEWYDAAVYGLAARLADDYMVNAPNVIARAEEELRLALAFDREGSIWFGEPY